MNGMTDTVATFTLAVGTLGATANNGTLTATGGYNLQGGTINNALGTGTATITTGTTVLNGKLGATTVTVSTGTLTFGNDYRETRHRLQPQDPQARRFRPEGCREQQHERFPPGREEHVPRWGPLPQRAVAREIARHRRIRATQLQPGARRFQPPQDLSRWIQPATGRLPVPG